MEKQKKWQFILILSVIALTIYHILPTVFFYTKPLKNSITEKQCESISKSICKRVNGLEKESIDWLSSFCNLIHVNPSSIQPEENILRLKFAKSEDVERFKKFLPRAGALIPFSPSQLGLAPQEENTKEVLVLRRVATSLNPTIFSYAKIGSETYKDFVLDRVSQIAYALTGSFEKKDDIHIGSKNPIFSKIYVDWDKNKIILKLHPTVDAEKLEQPLINEIAKVTQISQESLNFQDGQYVIELKTIPDSSGFLLINLASIFKKQEESILNKLKTEWAPNHPDLETIAIVSEREFNKLKPEEQTLSLIVHTPTKINPSFYISFNGVEQILKTYEEDPNSELAAKFGKDLQKLILLLTQNGFQGYRNQKEELIFEKIDAVYSTLAATREDFKIFGTRKYAALELSNVEQRLLKENKIDTQIHSELCKWKDEYNAAQVSLQPLSRFSTPKPTKSPLISNILLTLKKYFRGDESRVIHWGLDLSGGKSVQIELKDAAGNIVTNDEDLKQGINELYQRVNKMGVSEVSIRRHGNTIVLDFPGSQTLSASELITSSSMYFHVVNEKFSSLHSPHMKAAQTFLSEVWNEAIATGKKTIQEINEIAYNHLHGNHKTESATTLLENGLILQNPKNGATSNSVENTVSKIAFIRGDKWFSQTQPLMFVFNNHALLGAELDRVQPNYDPQKGNYLSFEVKKEARDPLHAWTSTYSKEKVVGTDLGSYTQGFGWRMAVVLNDSIISAPTLDAVIRDSATISGQFSQREAMQLSNDLKAGSLTYTPHILSEKNVSPELGAKDRNQGIIATIVALFLVMIAMIAYYRFAGLIASIAVLFNLLILWATLQNLGATLTLAGIAGIILTVGMAVDANVLVFERIKEEFALTNSIKSAIKEGYKKAYSAIVDSNVTTIIAALILLNFDAGPIKGFAITLIIGIVSSMFTALFMTRFYFTSWMQNPKNTALNMANWIYAKSIDFLKHTKLAFSVAAIIITLGTTLLVTKNKTIFGMDFTGGFSLQVELIPDEKQNYLTRVEEAFLDQKIKSQDFQIRELSPQNQLRILFGTQMEQEGKPFYNLPVEIEGKNPRIEWVISSLASKGLTLTPSSLSSIEKNWTAMSGQMSESMRNNALLGLLISLVFIFIYISIRFEYKFAAASILCLIHDVLITLGFMGILHAFGVPIQIDLNTVAAIMTIVGYSLNDTIIVFDRIREEMNLHRNRSLARIVNHALNTTLSRTSITSGTTLLVLIALVILGGSSIFSFALVMTIGVFFGTLSSWYIAAPLMLYFHKKEEGKVSIIVEG